MYIKTEQQQYEYSKNKMPELQQRYNDEQVTNAPADWTGDRYTFDGTTWAQNPDWVEPEQLIGEDNGTCP